MKNIGLFLMTEKGYHSLLAVCEAELASSICFVCIGEDKAVSNDFSTEIETLCQKYEIPFFKNTSKKTLPTADYNVAISWRWLLKCYNLIVFHDSLLPKYRGFAPLVNALINGENQVGVTALLASDEYDRGDILLQKKIDIHYPITINKTIHLVSALYSDIMLAVIKMIISGNTLSGYKQEEKDATYSLWLDEKDYFIDWNMDSNKIKRKIDACGFPFLYAKSWINKREIRIEDCEPVEDVVIENRTAGKVIFVRNGCPVIVCGTGLLMIKSAYYTDNNESFIPLKKFRIRLTNDTVQ